MTGGAIAMMHYIGMYAAKFMPMSTPMGSMAHAINITDLGLLSIAVATVMLLGLVFLTSTIDRRFAVLKNQRRFVRDDKETRTKRKWIFRAVLSGNARRI